MDGFTFNELISPCKTSTEDTPKSTMIRVYNPKRGTMGWASLHHLKKRFPKQSEKLDKENQEQPKVVRRMLAPSLRRISTNQEQIAGNAVASQCVTNRNNEARNPNNAPCSSASGGTSPLRRGPLPFSRNTTLLNGRSNPNPAGKKTVLPLSNQSRVAGPRRSQRVKKLSIKYQELDETSSGDSEEEQGNETLSEQNHKEEEKTARGLKKESETVLEGPLDRDQPRGGYSLRKSAGSLPTKKESTQRKKPLKPKRKAQDSDDSDYTEELEEFEGSGDSEESETSPIRPVKKTRHSNGTTGHFGRPAPSRMDQKRLTEESEERRIMDRMMVKTGPSGFTTNNVTVENKTEIPAFQKAEEDINETGELVLKDRRQTTSTATITEATGLLASQGAEEKSADGATPGESSPIVQDDIEVVDIAKVLQIPGISAMDPTFGEDQDDLESFVDISEDYPLETSFEPVPKDTNICKIKFQEDENNGNLVPSEDLENFTISLQHDKCNETHSESQNFVQKREMAENDEDKECGEEEVCQSSPGISCKPEKDDHQGLLENTESNLKQNAPEDTDAMSEDGYEQQHSPDSGISADHSGHEIDATLPPILEKVDLKVIGEEERSASKKKLETPPPLLMKFDEEEDSEVQKSPASVKVDTVEDDDFSNLSSYAETSVEQEDVPEEDRRRYPLRKAVDLKKCARRTIAPPLNNSAEIVNDENDLSLEESEGKKKISLLRPSTSTEKIKRTSSSISGSSSATLADGESGVSSRELEKEGQKKELREEAGWSRAMATRNKNVLEKMGSSKLEGFEQEIPKHLNIFSARYENPEKDLRLTAKTPIVAGPTGSGVFPAMPIKSFYRSNQNIRFDAHVVTGKTQEELYCSKCCQYNCRFHGVLGKPFTQPTKKQEKLATLPKARIRLEENDQLSAQQLLRSNCGDSCHLHNKPTEGVRPYTEEQMKDRFSTLALASSSATPCQIADYMNSFGSEEIKSCSEISALLDRLPREEKFLEEVNAVNIKLLEDFRKNNDHLKTNNDTWTTFCSHRGACAEGCPCFNENLICSKNCLCPQDCGMKWQGCRCDPGKCDTSACPCVYAKRGCDPDLCRKCNSCAPINWEPSKEMKQSVEEEADLFQQMIMEKDKAVYGLERGEASWPKPNEKKKAQLKTPYCKNVRLLYGQQEQTEVKLSQFGYGLFASKNLRKGDYLGEYIGEIISEHESERRERVYADRSRSYQIDLTKDCCLDADSLGNHTRFVNNKKESESNAEARVELINGVQRIGFYTKQAVAKGEEIFFNYNYDKDLQMTYFGKIL